MHQVFMDGETVTLGPMIGNPGGEAIVYQLDDQRVVKLYHVTSDDQTARLKWAISQKIYHGFSKTSAVPKKLVYRDTQQTIVAGFVMPYLNEYRPLLEFLEAEDQFKLNIDISIWINIFSKLHAAIRLCHNSGFVIGDLNSRNILIKYVNRNNIDVRLIDTDSWGYAGFNKGWMPIAIDQDIEHPELSLINKDGTTLGEWTLRKRLFERDWYAFSLHLAHALCCRNPFHVGTTPECYSMNQRKAKFLTIWHRRVKANRKDMAYAMRLGPKMIFILKNWLNNNSRGEFPIEFITGEFADGITRCNGKYFSDRTNKHRSCEFHLRQIHSSSRYCPLCMGKLIP